MAADDPLAPEYPIGPAIPPRSIAGPPPRFRRASAAAPDATAGSGAAATAPAAPTAPKAHRFERVRNAGAGQEEGRLPRSFDEATTDADADNGKTATTGRAPAEDAAVETERQRASTDTPASSQALRPATTDLAPIVNKQRASQRPLTAEETATAAETEAAADAVGSRRLRPRARSAEELAASAALAAEAPRHFQEPTPEEKLGFAASRWLRLTAILVAAILLPTLGFIVGRWWHKRHVVFSEEFPVPPDAATAPGTAAAPATAAAGARRPSQPLGPQFPPGVAEWPETEIAALDAALKADRTGARVEATQLARAQRDRLAGDLRQAALVDRYLAELAIREKRGRDAQTLLFPLTRSGPYISPASDRLAFIQCRSRRFDEATEYFSRAAAYDPLSGVYFYRWGEALRRQGKLQDAIARFEQALLRQSSSDPLSAPPITALKLRLTRIEAGQTAEVRVETDERLRVFADTAQAPQLDAGEWLLTAAALDLQEDKFVSAAEWLRKARALLPGGRYEEQIADYFFRNFAHRSELASVLPTVADADTRRQALAARPDVYFVDP